MATSKPDFYESQRFSPEPFEQLPRQRGCFFYGCLFASILGLLILIAGGIAVYFLYRAADRLVQEYTATEAQELPKVEMPAEQRQTLEERIQAFRKAIDAGEKTDPLVLTGDDINAWIENHTALKGKIYVALEGDKIKAKLSMPLSDILDIGLTRGRYVNGEAELKASLEDGIPIVTIESIEVNGKRPPDAFLAQLRQNNLAKDLYKNPEYAAELRKLESITIKDSRMIIETRSQDKASQRGTPQGQRDLPDDVLAPPDSGGAPGKPSQVERPTDPVGPSMPVEPKRP